MKYFVELTDVHLGIEPGRLCPIYWDPQMKTPRVNFPQEFEGPEMLYNWEDSTGYVFSPSGDVGAN